MEFKGVSLDKTIEDFLKEFEKKGGSYMEKVVNGKYVPRLDEGEIDINGKLAGYKFSGKASYSLISHKVYEIYIEVDDLVCPLKRNLEKFVHNYKVKYGKPAEVDSTGLDYLDWTYSCAFYTDDGIIRIKSESDRPIPCISYMFSDNAIIADQERKKILLEEI